MTPPPSRSSVPPPSWQLAQRERVEGGAGCSQGPGLEAALHCQGLVAWPHHTTREAGKCRPGTLGKRDRAWGSCTHGEQAPCTRQSKDSFQPWGGLGGGAWDEQSMRFQMETCLADPASASCCQHPLSTRDMLPHEAFFQSCHLPWHTSQRQGTDQPNPAFLRPQYLPSTKWEEK